MTYQEALAYIHSVSWRGSMPGLSRIQELCARMGNPERGLRFIHIAGTNGKGSTAAYLSSVLRAAGYRTGAFTSPYVKTFNERISIDGRPVSNALLAAATESVRHFADEMQDPPTEFELITAIGFECFRRRQCEFVVLEVGLGGRYDSTNVIEAPLLSVITGIALDHTQLLGATLDKIAFEKAGIIKEGRPVCLGVLPPEARAVILREAREKHAPFCEVRESALRVKALDLDHLCIDYGDCIDLESRLIGLYQPRNIALVCEAVRMLEAEGVPVGTDALHAGIRAAQWHARFEVLQREPPVIFDGGHNPDGVRAAVETAKRLFSGKINVLTGILADKDYETMADSIAEIAGQVFTVTPDNPRALSAEALAEVFIRRSIPARPCGGIGEGVRAARRFSRRAQRPLLILGSLYMYKDVYRHFCRRPAGD